MNRKSICLSMDEKDIANFDYIVEFLTILHGFRFTRTSALLYLIRFYRDHFDHTEIKGGAIGQEKIQLPF